MTSVPVTWAAPSPVLIFNVGMILSALWTRTETSTANLRVSPNSSLKIVPATLPPLPFLPKILGEGYHLSTILPQYKLFCLSLSLSPHLTSSPFLCHSPPPLSPSPEFDRCNIHGDPHYRTFDGFTHHFQGPYTYTLTEGHSLLSSLASLQVRGKNSRRGGSKISYLDEVYVDVYGVSIRFLQKKVVLVS